MKYLSIVLAVLLFNIGQTTAIAQESNIQFKLSYENSFSEEFKKRGRLFVMITLDSGLTPYTQIYPHPNPTKRTYIFGKTFRNIALSQTVHFEPKNWIHNFKLGALTNDQKWYAQVVWDKDTVSSGFLDGENLRSDKFVIEPAKKNTYSVELNNIIPQKDVIDHPLARKVDYTSELLSEWWKREYHVYASVLLPHNYDSTKTYPISYNVSGFAGRYYRINDWINSEKFMNWWDSPEAPQVISVFLDGEGPYGDSYQMDSENSGPFGSSLIYELIPHIEEKYRGTTENTNRYVNGCSTGGWVSLALLLFYPEYFSGAYVYSPDPVDFSDYLLIDIYEDSNAFVNEYNYERPFWRSTDGEPRLSIRDFVKFESTYSMDNSYLTSRWQYGAHAALYGPVGENGLPKPLFDQEMGEIDQTVAAHWKKYDLLHYLQENWPELGPKIQGKLHVWCGDMDHFYLNTPTRNLEEFLSETSNPESDARFEFTPMAGHCSNFNLARILKQIEEEIE